MKLFGAIIGTDEVVEKMPINIDIEAGNQIFPIKTSLLYGKEAEYSYQSPTNIQIRRMRALT